MYNTNMVSWLKKHIFLLLAFLVLIVPSFYYWFYPAPQHREEYSMNLKQEYEAFKSDIIDSKAKAGKMGGAQVFGGTKDVERRIALIYEIELEYKLIRMKEDYDRRIEELNKFPLTNVLVIVGVFISCLGLYYSSREE